MNSTYWKRVLIILSCLVISGQTLASASTTPTVALKVITLNLHNGKDARGERNLERFTQFVIAEQPDIIALQEVQPKDLKRLELPGYRVITGPNANYIPFYFGNALLTRRPILYHRHHYLPSQKEQRGVDEVAIAMNGQTLRVLNTHIGLGREEQRRQIRELVRISGYLPGPVLITGDFNLEPSNPLLREFPFREVSAAEVPYKTFPAGQPKYQIDQIWYNDYLKLREARALRWDGSDHLPVTASLLLTNGAAVTAGPIPIPDLTLQHNPLLPDVGGAETKIGLTLSHSPEDSLTGIIELPFKKHFLIRAGSDGENSELALGYRQNIDLRDYYSLRGVRGKAQWDWAVASDLSGQAWLKWDQYYRWSNLWGTRLILAGGEQKPACSWEHYYLPTPKLRISAGYDSASEFRAGLAFTPGKRQILQVQYRRGDSVEKYSLGWEYWFFSP
jgi:endonuclease/exonuclease/phosphatase family metal-dependent hydrolase